jgi:hypothetical protein
MKQFWDVSWEGYKLGCNGKTDFADFLMETDFGGIFTETRAFS